MSIYTTETGGYAVSLNVESTEGATRSILMMEYYTFIRYHESLRRFFSDLLL